MSTKFEQLLDFLVNEDHEKANELFHEIVVEKSREIYENLIAEEEADEDMDESMDDEEREMDESKEEDDEDQQDESMDLEDSYMMDADETGDATDDFGGEISADGDNFDAPEHDGMDDEHDHEGQEDTAIMDIKNAIEELEAAFAELERAQGGEEAEMGMDGEEHGEEEFGDEEDEDEGMGFMEGRRMTREYVEKVGHNYGTAQKTDGDDAGAGTGERQSKPSAGKSPVSSGKGKPTTGANAGNILGGKGTAEGTNTGTTPPKVSKGINPEKGEQFTGKEWEANSKPGAHTKGYAKKETGWPQGGKTAGPVGSGTGDKAGQTSIDPATKRQFLPQHTK